MWMGNSLRWGWGGRLRWVKSYGVEKVLSLSVQQFNIIVTSLGLI